MLKLSSSFMKKVPAEEDYSSKSYHATLEVELSDGITDEQLKERIKGTFNLVRDSVENQIVSDREAIIARLDATATPPEIPKPDIRNTQPAISPVRNNAATPYNKGNSKGTAQRSSTPATPASPRQIKFLTDLARQYDVRLEEYLKQLGLRDVSELTFKQCSRMIDMLRGSAAA